MGKAQQLAFIAFLALTLILFLSIFFKFPESVLGIDEIPHVAKIMIIRYWGFEAFKWVPAYYFGNPHFHLYPPSTYFLPLLISQALNLNLSQVIELFNWHAYLSMFLLFSGAYLLIYRTTNNNLSAFLATLTLFFAPLTYEPWLFGGNYPEVYTLPTIPWSLIFLSNWLSTNKKRDFILYTLIGVYALTGHIAVAAFFVFFSILWIVSEENIQKPKTLFKALLPTLMISSFHLIPYYYLELTMKLRWSILDTVKGPPPIEAITAVLGSPLFIFLLFFGIFTKIRKSNRILFLRHRANLRRVIIFSSFLILLTVYSFSCFLFSAPFPYGFPPYRHVVFINLFASITLGIMLPHIPRSFIKILFIMLLITAFIFFQVSPKVARVLQSIIDEKLANFELFKDDYRIGALDDNFINVLNLYKPSLYTSRGYYIQGVLYIDWQYWFESVVFKGNFTRKIMKNSMLHLLDWGGVKYVAYSIDEAAPVDFKEFNLLEETNFYGKRYLIFEWNSSSIAEGLMDGAILFIGDEVGYDMLLRVIAISDYYSPAPIITWAGDKCIDEFTHHFLRRFSGIILFRYCYDDPERAWKLLEEYVEGGGRLFVETASSPDYEDVLPLFMPVKQVYWTMVSTWNFSTRGGELMIDEERFSPPVYEGGPWGVSAAYIESLKPDAQPIIATDDFVFISTMKYGEGEVVWSGMNLLYHALYYSNLYEANLLRKLIFGNITQSLVRVDVIRKSATDVKFVCPSGVKGIVFRERFISNEVLKWETNVEDAEILMVGPGFTYISFDGELKGERIVDLRMVDGIVVISAYLISMFGLFLLFVRR